MNCSDSASPLVCACVCHESCRKALQVSVNCEYKVGDTLTVCAIATAYMWMILMIGSCTLYCTCILKRINVSVRALYYYTRFGSFDWTILHWSITKNLSNHGNFTTENFRENKFCFHGLIFMTFHEAFEPWKCPLMLYMIVGVHVQMYHSQTCKSLDMCCTCTL